MASWMLSSKSSDEEKEDGSIEKVISVVIDAP
jgi:hypothetical protein